MFVKPKSVNVGAEVSPYCHRTVFLLACVEKIVDMRASQQLLHQLRDIGLVQGALQSENCCKAILESRLALNRLLPVDSISFNILST